MVQLPPPIHGSSQIGVKIKEIIENKYPKSKFLNISLSPSSKKIGIFDVNKLLLYSRILFQLCFMLIVYRPNLIYFAPTISGLGFYKDLFCVILIKIFKKHNTPLIYHLHNRSILGLIKKKSLNFHLYTFFFKKTKVIVLSKIFIDDVSTFVNLKDIYVLPNCVNDNFSFSKKDQDFTFKQNIITFGFLSNLIKSKGILDLLDAARIIKMKGFNFNLLIGGSEVDLNYVDLSQHIKNYNLENNVKLLGPIYNSEKVNFFQKIDFFVFPTYYHMECMPLVLIEAASYSLPIISTNIAAISDIVTTENGFLINPRDVNLLSNQIIQLLTNPILIDKLGSNSRLMYLNNFSPQIFEKSFLDIIDDLY